MSDKVQKALRERKLRSKEHEEELKAANPSFKASIDKVNAALETRKNRLVSQVDDNYINAFISDVNNFFSSAEEDYNGIKWDNASSMYDSKYGAWMDLKSRKKVLNTWLERNKESLSEDGYNKLSSVLNEFDSGSSSIINAFKNANDHYSQWETEDEYNDAVKVSGLYNMSSSEIKAEMDKATADSSSQISALQTELDDLNNKIRKYGRGDRSAFKTAKEYNDAKIRKNELTKQIDELSQKSAIAHTTLSGQNITWQNLYDQKKTEEDFNALYAKYSANPDWEEQSKYITTNKKGTARGNAVLGTDTDWKYEDINKYDPYFTAMGYSPDVGYAEQTTPEEKALFNYIYHTVSPEAAYEWHNSREHVYKDRLEEKGIQTAVKFAEEYPVFSDLVGVAASVLSGGEAIGDLVTGNIGDTNQTAAVSSAIKGTRMEQIDWEVGEWDVFDFLYGTGTSMAESAASMALFGKFGGIALGLSAAGHATNDALNRGMSKGQAFTSGVASGIFECLFETWSIGAFKGLTKNLKRADFRSLAKYVGKNIWNNAKEELLTEIANVAYDTAINGEFSQAETAIRQLMASGVSESDAKKQVAAKLGLQIAEAAASGALMGLGFGGGGAVSTAFRTAQVGKTIKDAGQTDNLVDLGKSLGEGTDAYELANKVANKPTALAIGSLLGVAEDDISTANKGDIVKSLERKGYDTETANRLADLMLSPGNNLYANSRGLTSEGKTYNDILNNPDSTVNQRTQSYVDILDNLEKESTSPNAETESSQTVSAPYSQEYIESVAKKLEASGMTTEQAQIVAEMKLSNPTLDKTTPSTGTAVKSEYDVSAEGKTKNTKTGDVVNIKNIDSISESGEANLTLEDKTVVKASDLSFGSEAEALFVENIGKIKLGKKNISITAANSLYMVAMEKFKKNLNMTASEAMALIKGLEESYIYGAYNFGESKLAKSGSVAFANELTEQQRKFAYELGSQDRVSEVESKQKTVDKVVSKAKPKTKKAHFGKVVFESQINEKTLNSTKKANLEGIKLLAELTNYEFHVFESDENLNFTMPNGAVRSANGWYNVGTNEIWIDIKSGVKGEGTMLWTAAHEIGHDLRVKTPKQWQAMADLIMKTFAENDVNVGGMLNNQMAKIKRRYKGNESAMPSESVILDMAYEELVSDALFDMLTDGSIVNFMAEVKSKDRNVWQKIMDAIKGLLEKWGLVIDSYKGRTPDTAEAQALSQFEDVFKQVQEMYQEALMEANEVNAVLNADKALKLAEVGIGVDEVNGEVFALRDSFATNDKITIGKKSFDIDAVAELVSEVTGRSIEDSRKWVQSEMTVANIVMRNPEFLDFEADDRYEAIKKNSDYPQGTVDLSNNCPKRAEFTSMFDVLQKKYPNKLFTAQDVAEMRSILADNNITVACGACFVEDRRQLLGEIADTYINMWKEAVETGKPLHKTNAEGKKIKLTVTAALAKQYGVTKGADIIATDKYIPTQYDLTTYEGFKLLEKNHPTIAMGFNRYNNSRGQQAGRLIEGRAEYKRQILGWSDATVKKVNNNGGLRIFSFSDFEVVHLLDLVQIIIDCSAKGVKIQGYTKIPAFAKLVRNTGIKLNRSLIPKGDTGIKVVNGKKVLDIDTTEGIDINDENFLDERDNPDVGNVIIGINPEQIGIAMLDNNIDYIIPFHSNKAKAILKALGLESWVNYKKSQHEKDIATGENSKHNVNIYTQVIDKYKPANKVEFVDAFLKECKKQGKIPRYAEFLHKEYKENGAYTDEGGNFDYTYREGYHKLLVDFKMFDKEGNILPQGQITPTLDDAFMTELLNAEVDKKQNYQFPQEVYDQIEEKFGGETMFSDRDSEGNTLSEGQQTFFKDSKLRDSLGRLLRLFHGTRKGGFTKFSTKYSDDGITLFLTANREIAETYSGSNEKIQLPEGKKGLARLFEKGTDKGNGQSGVYEVYANVKKLFVLEGNGGAWDSLPFTEKGKSTAAIDLKFDVQGKTLTLHTEINGKKNDKTFDLSAYDEQILERQKRAEEEHLVESPYGSELVSVMRKDLNNYFSSITDNEKIVKRFFSLANGVMSVENEKGSRHWLVDNKTGQVNTPNTRYVAKWAKNNGYDGVMFKNVIDTAIVTEEPVVGDVVVVFDSSQIKSVDNLNPTKNKDIRYSDRDSNGNELSDGQIEYFKDSKVRDKDGNLLVAYHGTPNDMFYEFDPSKQGSTTNVAAWGKGFYFSDEKTSYTWNGVVGAKNSLVCYLNITKPFMVYTDQVVPQDFKNYVMSTDAYKNSNQRAKDYLGDSAAKWHNFLQYSGKEDVNKVLQNLGYDGIIVGDYTEVVIFDSNQAKLTTNTNPTTDPDIRYSDRDSDYMDAVNRGDMETAQRMVDEAAKEAGYNYEGYHGTFGFGFTKFANRWNFFSNDEKFASEFIGARGFENGRVSTLNNPPATGEGIYRVYLSFKNPYIIDAKNNGWEEIEYNGEFLETDEVAARVWRDLRGKHDGIIIKNVAEGDGSRIVTDYITFSSNQSKSADPVTYDDNGNVIPLSQRFNKENEDIRYSERVSNQELAAMDETALYIKNTKKANYIGMIFNGTKTEETRSQRTLDAFIGKDFYVTDGKMVYGTIVLGEPHKYTEAEFRKLENRKKHRVPKGDEYDIKKGGIKWAYPIESYNKFDKPKKLSDSKEYKNSFQAREVMYSVRGESTATEELDKQNLETAKKMDEEKVPMENIRLATGWYKQSDGKWRSEFTSKKMKFKPAIDSIFENEAEFKELERLGKKREKSWKKLREFEKTANKKSFSYPFKYLELYDTPEKRAYEELEKSIKEKQRKAKTIKGKLEDVIYFPELFKLYPQLKDVNVVSTGIFKGTTFADWSREDNTIRISKELSKEKALDSLTHEIQHAIQDIEGFEYEWDKSYHDRRNEKEAFDSEARRKMSDEQRIANPPVMFSERDIQPITEAEYKDLEKHFGTTGNFKVAGYLLTNGKLLDFSGKHWGDTTSRMRQVDHRDVQEVLDGRGNNGVNAMIDMIGNGNIRLMPETGGINLAAYPNEKQRRVLSLYIRQMLATEGQVILDYDAVGGDTVYSRVYEKHASPSQILADIRNYFQGGRQSELMQFHTMYSERDPSASNRSILANALEGTAQNDIERNKLAQYKEKIALIESEEKRLSEIQKQLFTKGGVEPENRKALQFEAKQIANRINTYDRQLLNLESTTALKNVLNREKALAMKRQKQKDAEAMRDYKEKVAKTQRELLERHKESRKKAIEGRNKTILRDKIKKTVNELNTLLLKGSKERNVKLGLQDSVAKALEVINMDTVGADERVAHYNDLIAKAKDPDVIASLTETRDRIKQQGENLAEKLEAMKNAYAEIRRNSNKDYAQYYQQEAELIEYVIDDVIKEVGNTSIRDMSLSQLEAVYNMYKVVLQTIRYSNELHTQGKVEELRKNASEMMAELEKIKTFKEERVALADNVRGFSWNEMIPIYAVKRTGSQTLEKFYWEMIKGQNIFARDVEEAKNFSSAIQEKYGHSKWNLNKVHKFKLKDGRTFRLTLEHMMSIYAYSKREQALEHMTVGGFFFNDKATFRRKGGVLEIVKSNEEGYTVDVDVLNAITDAMEKEANGSTKYVDEMQDYLTKMGEKGNEVSRVVWGIDIFKEKVYFPLKSSKDFLFQANQTAQETSLKHDGMTKETKPGASNPIILEAFDDVWVNHVNRMSQYHGYVIPIDNMNKLLNYGSWAGTSSVSVTTMLKARFGSAVEEYLTQFIKDMNGASSTSGASNPFFGFVGAFKKTAVAASASVVVQQPTAILRALAVMDAKYFVGMPEAHKLSTKWAEVKKYAPIAIIKEIGGFEAGAGRQATEWLNSDARRGVDKILGQIDDITMWGAATGDQIGWCIIWEAVKREIKATTNLNEGSEDFLNAVGERFTEVIVLTQVYDSTLSRSGFMRSKHDSVKMFTAFMGEPTVSTNMMFDAVIQAKRKTITKRNASRIIGATYASIIAASVASSLIYALRDDDDDESYLEKFAEAFGDKLTDDLNPLNMLPGVRDIISIFDGWDVERTDMAVFKDIKDAFDGLFSDNKSPWRKVEDFAGAIASAFGVPLKNTLRTGREIYNMFDNIFDDITPSGVGEAFVRGITGEKKDKGEALYNAIVNGDDARLKVYRNEYKDDKAYETAVRKALRENDPRIREAAEARIEGDIAEYSRIVKEIKAEGNFVQDTIVAAVNAEINAINKGEGTESSSDTDKAKSMYTVDDYYAALDGGDQATAYVVKEDLIETDVANGKDREDAENSFNNKFANYIRDEYEEGNLSEYEAQKMLVNYGGKSEDEAASKVQYWAFKQDYPDYDDLSEEAVDKYYTDVKPYGITVDVYYDYYKKKSNCKGVDANNDGKTDSGSKKAEILKVINSLPLSRSQKDALYYLNGWSAKTIYEAPWH